GFDRFSHRTFGPRDATPYMSYSSPSWTDRYHWQGCFNDLDNRGQSPPPPSPSIALVQGLYDPVSGAVALVNTQIVDRTQLSVDQVNKFWGAQLDNLAQSGAQFTLESRLANGSLERAQSFALTPQCSETPMTRRTFTVIMPVSGTSSIRVLDAATS